MHAFAARALPAVSALALAVACADHPVASDPAEEMLATSAIGAAKAAAKGTPIKGHLEGTVSDTRISPTELVYRLENTATGVISHLGRSRADWVIPEMRFDPVRRQVGLPVVDWSGIMTAANGDKIFGRYHFRDSVIQFGLLGDFQAVADLTITGGTGRFQGVTGSGVSVISGNVWTERFAIDVRGEIFRIGR